MIKAKKTRIIINIGAVKNESFFTARLFRGQEKMRRMSKPRKNNTFVLFLVSPTAYKGTPRARLIIA